MLWRLARFAAGHLSYLSDRRILGFLSNYAIRDISLVPITALTYFI